MLASQFIGQDLTNEMIDRLLYDGLDYNGDSAPCAMVLGSNKADIYRVPVAVSLYKQGNIQKMLMCGGKEWNFPEGSMSEACRMKAKAMEEGVPDEDILMDEQSLTTRENMLCALLPLERAFKLNNVHKLILITSSFHMRRSLFTAKALLPNWIQIIPCPAEDTHTRRDNWWQSEAGRKRTSEEAERLLNCIRRGEISDFTI